MRSTVFPLFLSLAALDVEPLHDPAADVVLQKRGRAEASAPGESIFLMSEIKPQVNPAQVNAATRIRHPEEGYFSISVAEGGKAIVFAGYVAHGAAKKLAEFLDKAPEVRAIGFYSGGGRISEAQKIRALVSARKLDTYAHERCLSACTIAFVGGQKRYLERGSQLGFHASSSPDGIEFDQGSRRRDRDLIQSIVALGVDPTFVERAYNTPSKEMWYPSVEELVRSKFATAATDRQLFKSISTTHRFPVDALEPAVAALQKRDFENAVRLFRPLAETGDAFAQFVVGFAFSNGRGVKQDDKEATKWFRLAAEQGYAAAQNNLGTAYSKGLGVPQDEAQALHWIRRASEQGEMWAQANLARRYYQGIGVLQDHSEAARWYLLAAEQGNPSAKGLPQNNVSALMWLSLATPQLPPGTNNHQWAVSTRESLTTSMKPLDIAEAERLARAWRPK
jgi:TPR repeat protein